MSGSTPIKIIAVDPGAICGVAIFRTDTVTPGFISFEVPWLMAVSSIEDGWLDDEHWFIAAQKFTTGNRSVMTPQYDAMYTIGALQYISSQCNATFELQSRSEAKKVAPDAVLRRLGWFTKTKDGHANDGARHIVLTLIRHHPLEAADLLNLV